MKKQLVSIVVAAYNYGKYISETLQSVEKQTYSNWECIIIDDGSDDNTADEVSKFTIKDSRFVYYYQPNKGLPAARNAGIRIAKGDFFQWLDADDILQEQKLEKQVNLFLLKPQLDIVYGGLRYFYDNKPEVLLYSTQINRPWTLTKSGNTNELVKYLLVSCVIMPSMPIIRKKVLEEVGVFDESYRYVEDWNFWLRSFSKKFEIEYLDAPNTFILMRSHASSMTKNRVSMIRGFLKLRNEFNTWNVPKELKKLNSNLKINDEIEYFLTLNQSQDFYEIGQSNSLRFTFFKLLSYISKDTSLKTLKLFKSIQKKYLYWKIDNKKI